MMLKIFRKKHKTYQISIISLIRFIKKRLDIINIFSFHETNVNY